MTISRVLLRLLVVLSLMGWGRFVFAEDYYWQYTDGGRNQRFPNPEAACRQVAADQPRQEYLRVERETASRYSCFIRIFHANGTVSLPNYRAAYINRNGTTCTPPTVLDPATDSCKAPEPDKCEPTIGAVVEHRHRAGEFTGAGVIAGRTDPPGSVCRDQCQYAFSGTAPLKAYRFENGDPTGVFLAFKYKGNGVSCVGNESPFAQPSDGTPVVEKQSECTTKITDAEGHQRYDCQATELNIDPGNMDCSLGTVGGELQCIPKPPSPKMTDKKVDQEVVEKTNPDGSKDTTTTTTTTTTQCTGVKSCTTTTTTNVSNNHTKADGTPGGESNTCTGPGCKDADGKTQEEREEEEEKSESKVTGGQTCEAAPTCEGDAVQCAILKQQYEARCDFEESEDFESNKADIKGLFEGQGDKFKLDEGSGDIDVPSFINKGTRFLPATCPTAESFSLTTAGGRTFTLSYEPLCRAASDLSGLFVAVATILAALYVGRSVGGN